MYHKMDTSLSDMKMSKQESLDTSYHDSDFSNALSYIPYAENCSVYPESLTFFQDDPSTTHEMNSYSRLHLSSQSNSSEFHRNSTGWNVNPSDCSSSHLHRPNNLHHLQSFQERQQEPQHYLQHFPEYIEDNTVNSLINQYNNCAKATLANNESFINELNSHMQQMFPFEGNINCEITNLNCSSDQTLSGTGGSNSKNISTVDDILREVSVKAPLSEEPFDELVNNMGYRGSVSSEDSGVSRSSSCSMEDENCYGDCINMYEPEQQYNSYYYEQNECDLFPDQGSVYENTFKTQETRVGYGNANFSGYFYNGHVPEAPSYIPLQHSIIRQGSPLSDEGFVDEDPTLPYFNIIQQFPDSDRDSQSIHSISSSPKEKKKTVSDFVPSMEKERRKPGRKPGQVSNVLHLWEFMRDLLHSANSEGIIEWISKRDGVFRVVNSSEVARLWGEKKKNKKKMTYEKLSRSLRYSRLEGYFADLPKDKNYPKKLCFKFGPKSKNWL